MAVGIRVLREVPLDFYAEPLRRFFTEAMFKASEYLTDPGIGRTPRDESFLANSIAPGNGVTMVDENNPPEWARVGIPSGATGKAGASIAVYGGVLEESSRHHYLGGPNAGKKTQGWFTSVVDYMTPVINRDLIGQLAQDIEAAWQR